MKTRITLADIDNYLALLPEPAKIQFLRDNGDAIRFLYDREKSEENEESLGEGEHEN